MIREFNQQWEQDYVRKTTETLQAQSDRRKSAVEKNAQRTDIEETMGEGGGDEEEDGESEDDNEDGQGSGGAAKRNTTEKAAQLLLQNWCSAQDNCRQRS